MVNALSNPEKLKNLARFFNFSGLLKAFTIESQTVSSYFDEVLNEKPVGDRRYTISVIGFPSKMMELNLGFQEPGK